MANPKYSTSTETKDLEQPIDEAKYLYADSNENFVKNPHCIGMADSTHSASKTPGEPDGGTEYSYADLNEVQMTSGIKRPSTTDIASPSCSSPIEIKKPEGPFQRKVTNEYVQKEPKSKSQPVYRELEKDYSYAYADSNEVRTTSHSKIPSTTDLASPSYSSPIETKKPEGPFHRKVTNESVQREPESKSQHVYRELEKEYSYAYADSTAVRNSMHMGLIHPNYFACVPPKTKEFEELVTNFYRELEKEDQAVYGELENEDGTVYRELENGDGPVYRVLEIEGHPAHRKLGKEIEKANNYTDLSGKVEDNVYYRLQTDKSGNNGMETNEYRI